jgi:hypothetical protein
MAVVTIAFPLSDGVDTDNVSHDLFESTPATIELKNRGNETNVVLLLPFNGADAATATTDYSDTGHTIDFGGDAQLDQAQKKYGSASLLLDGTGDYIGFNDNISDVSFTSGDFTIELWAYLNEAMGVSQRRLFGKGGGDAGWGNTANSYFGDILDTDEKLRFRYRTAGDGNTILSSDAAIDVTGGFHHIAYVNDTGNSRFRMFVGGTEVNSIGAPANITINDSTGGTQVFNIGVHSTGPDATDWKGWMDEFRIYNGTAKYTSDFTPSTAGWGYIDTSPSPAGQWTSLKDNNGNLLTNSVIKMDTAILIMEKDGVIQAATNTDVKLKYKANNAGSFSSALTLTNFRLEDDITVTHANTFQAIPVLASDGTYKSSCRYWILIDVEIGGDYSNIINKLNLNTALLLELV